jgi:uncharacterized membrane protein YdbT with pleckstrin-like domain
VAFPKDILTSDEHVAMHLRPHWKVMLRPVLVVLLGIVVVVAGWQLLPRDTAGQITLYAIGGVVLVLVGWLALWPSVVWRTTHYVFTNERVVLQRGVFHRERRDIPLHRVSDHAMNQKLWERALGCGTMVIESAGEQGQTTLTDIPKVQQAQTLLYDLVDADRDKHALGDDEMREILGEKGPDATFGPPPGPDFETDP